MKDIIVITKTCEWFKDGKTVTTITNEPFHTCLPQTLAVVLLQLLNGIQSHDPEREKGFDAEWLTAIRAPRTVSLLDRYGNPLSEVKDSRDIAYIMATYAENGEEPILTETYSVRTIQTGWRFIGEEEVGDEASPILFLGVLTNGEDCLYYRVEKDHEGRDICTIHNSLTFEDGSEEVSYPWTADNDQKVIDALDAVTDRRLIAGEESVLRDIQFDL